MTESTKIEWTDATWNALRGCTRVSAGCANCYAEGIAGRFSDPGQWGHGIATREPESAERYILRGRWTGQVVLDEAALLKPLRWRKPRRIFVTSMSDPFHPSVTDDMLDRLFAVMALTPQHTYQLLTKRPERMWRYLSMLDDRGRHPAMTEAALIAATGRWSTPGLSLKAWPLPNLWLGTSVENQAAAEARIPYLLAAPAALRFLSCEPLLGPVDLRKIKTTCGVMGGHAFEDDATGYTLNALEADGGEEDSDDPHGLFHDALDWVIVGGESGPKARPMHPAWARGLRDQCAAAGVPFFMKQMGGSKRPFPCIPDDLNIKEWPHA